MKQKIFYGNRINKSRAFYAMLRFKMFNVYTPFLTSILGRNRMQKKKNFARKKYISQLLFDDIKSFLSNKHDITRKELCNTFKLFKYNTLKAEDSRGDCDCIGVSAYSGRDALYTPKRILAYIERKFKIIKEEDIDCFNI